MSWFYGLVREETGKIRIWEIMEEKNYLWGHRGFTSWILRDIGMVIKDLLAQKNHLGKLWDGKELEKGNKKFIKKVNKQIKNINFDKMVKK